MECAKEIYKNPYIFDQSKTLTPKERHNNLREILNIIDNSINNAIRDLLPIRDILKQGLTKNNLYNSLNDNNDINPSIYESIKENTLKIKKNNDKVSNSESTSDNEIDLEEIDKNSKIKIKGGKNNDDNANNNNENFFHTFDCLI